MTSQIQSQQPSTEKKVLVCGYNISDKISLDLIRKMMAALGYQWKVIDLGLNRLSSKETDIALGIITLGDKARNQLADQKATSKLELPSLDKIKTNKVKTLELLGQLKKSIDSLSVSKTTPPLVAMSTNLTRVSCLLDNNESIDVLLDQPEHLARNELLASELDLLHKIVEVLNPKSVKLILEEERLNDKFTN